MRIKICGITNIKDAICAANHGAWAIGFNLYKKSKRYIPFSSFIEMSANLPINIIKIGILIDYSNDDILDALNFFDLVQIYQHDESVVCDKKRLILSIQASSKTDLPSKSIMQKYGYILLDAERKQDGLFGGTGRLSNWILGKELSQSYKLILAGGLNINNTAKALVDVNPFAVDIASSIESSPGIKDHELIKEFLIRYKNVN